MIPVVILLGVLLIMACNQNPIAPPSIPTDPAIPVPPPNPNVVDATPVDGSVGVGGRTDNDGYLLNVDPGPPAYVDPSIPLPAPRDGGDVGSGGTLSPGAGDVFFGDPWEMDPVYIPPSPDLPVKTNPVAYVPPVYFDPQNPVPTDAEKAAAAIGVDPSTAAIDPPQSPITQPTDFSYPVPTPDTDPTLYASDPPVDVGPADNVMDNWTAENTDDTVCDPSVSVEFALE